MKSSILILSILVMPFLSSAHEFFFSFAEVEYNPITERFEMTLTVTTHDLETALENQGTEINNLASLTETEIEQLEAYVNKHTVLKTDTEKSIFTYSGHDTSLNGTSNFYFESAPISFSGELTIKYDLLMEAFPEQQNKMTLYCEDKTRTAAFTRMNKTKTIYFENQKQ